MKIKLYKEISAHVTLLPAIAVGKYNSYINSHVVKYVALTFFDIYSSNILGVDERQTWQTGSGG